LTKKEIKELEELMNKTSDAKVYRRAQIILLSNTKVKVPDIVMIVRMSDEHIKRWIRRYEKEGINGLFTRPKKGRPPKVTEEYKKELLKCVETRVRRY
jgi:transposase